MAIVTKVNLADFKKAIAAIEKRELTDAAKEVIGKIKEGILFLKWAIRTMRRRSSSLKSTWRSEDYSA